MRTVRRYGARWLDVLALLVVAAALVRFVVFPLLRPAVRPAPAVMLATVEGSRFTLAGAPGRVVFLDFMATWCDPCRDEIPLVQRFERMHPEARVVPIDVGESPALVAPFARRFGLRGVALDGDEKVAHAYAVAGFPTVVAVDARGRIRARWIGFDPDIERHLTDALQRYAAR